MMKKLEYGNPKIEIIHFKDRDMIVTSGLHNGGTDGIGDEFEWNVYQVPTVEAALPEMQSHREC